jgi:hypothetical protein
MPAESWILDSLPLSSGAFDLLEVNADPPAQRQSWITAADSESPERCSGSRCMRTARSR